MSAGTLPVPTATRAKAAPRIPDEPTLKEQIARRVTRDDSSGKTTNSAPSATIRAYVSATFAAFPSKSPTTVLICANPTFIHPQRHFSPARASRYQSMTTV